jgi:NhaP-type Na+/H+ or K+/H+ antiporter
LAAPPGLPGETGPKGVASMLFALLVLTAAAPDRTVVFDVASFVILASILAHGLTDYPGSEWMANHAAAKEKRATAAIAG